MSVRNRVRTTVPTQAEGTAPANVQIANQFPQLVAADLTPSESALQRSYQLGKESAETATEEINNDKIEVVNMIGQYAVQPLEILHLGKCASYAINSPKLFVVDRWIQQLLNEFLGQKSSFKLELESKWFNDQLISCQFDQNKGVRRIYAAYQQLLLAQKTYLSHQAFDDANAKLNNMDPNATDDLKTQFHCIAQDYRNTLVSINIIDQESRGRINHNNELLHNIRQTLKKLEELNNKPSHRICIVGLEKAGKSTFINALIGSDLLPTASERCTQLRTVLKPQINENNATLYAKVKFYDETEFHHFLEQMPQKTDENEEQLEERKNEVSEKYEQLKGKFPVEMFHIDNTADLETQRRRINASLHEYITGEVYVNIIKEIAIYTDRLPGK
jgi:hypothetical protein